MHRYLGVCLNLVKAKKSKSTTASKKKKKPKKEKVVTKEEEEVEVEKEQPFSILQHILVPKHEILSEEEKQELLARYGIQPHQLPFISINDPVVREIGAKVGDIIKITRESETAGKAVYYRRRPNRIT